MIELPFAAKCIAALKECFVRIRIERKGAIEVCNGALGLIDLQQESAAPDEGKPEARSQRDCLLVLLEGAFVVVAHLQGPAARNVRVWPLRSQFDGAVEVGSRLIELPAVSIGEPTIVICLPGTGIEPECLGKALPGCDKNHRVARGQLPSPPGCAEPSR